MKPVVALDLVPRRIPVLPALCAATTLVVLGNGLLWPLIAIRLTQMHYSATAVGAFVMMPWLLTGLLVAIVPRVIRTIGPVAVYRWGCVLEAAGGLGFAASDSVPLWVFASFIGGIGGAALWNAGETLLAQGVAASQRGRAIGVYQTCIGVGLALGPLLPGLLGWSGHSLLSLTALLLFAAAVASLLVLAPRTRLATPVAVPTGLWCTIAATPALSCLAFIAGIFEVGLSAISAAEASSRGLPLALASGMAGAIGLGSLLAHYPAGWAADRLKPATGFLVGASLLFAACAIAAADIAPDWFPWLVAGLWGAGGAAFYTLTMTRAVRGTDSAPPETGAAAVIAAYTWGATAGPLLSGAVLDLAGATALLASLAAMAACALFAAHQIQ